MNFLSFPFSFIELSNRFGFKKRKEKILNIESYSLKVKCCWPKSFMMYSILLMEKMICSHWKCLTLNPVDRKDVSFVSFWLTRSDVECYWWERCQVESHWLNSFVFESYWSNSFVAESYWSEKMPNGILLVDSWLGFPRSVGRAVQLPGKQVGGDSSHAPCQAEHHDPLINKTHSLPRSCSVVYQYLFCIMVPCVRKFYGWIQNDRWATQIKGC